MSHKSKKATLRGLRIAVTRASEQASELSAKLQELEAEVVELPLIKISQEIDKQNLADCMLELGSYDWLVFTSANGVRFFFKEFLRLFEDIRALGLLRIAVVGEATEKAVGEYHLRVECKPAVATAEGLAKALVDTGSLDSAKVLLITGNLNRDVLVQKLEAARAIVDRLQVYKTELADLTENPLTAVFRKEGADAVLFASSSAVDAYASQGSLLRPIGSARQPLFGSIGPQTSESLRQHGMKVDFEAEKPSLDALVHALIRCLSKD